MRHSQLVIHLKGHQALRRRAKPFGEPQGCVCGDASFAEHNITEARGRHMQGHTLFREMPKGSRKSFCSTLPGCCCGLFVPSVLAGSVFKARGVPSNVFCFPSFCGEYYGGHREILGILQINSLLKQVKSGMRREDISGYASRLLFFRQTRRGFIVFRMRANFSAVLLKQHNVSELLHLGKMPFVIGHKNTAMQNRKGMIQAI